MPAQRRAAACTPGRVGMCSAAGAKIVWPVEFWDSALSLQRSAVTGQYPVLIQELKEAVICSSWPGPAGHPGGPEAGAPDQKAQAVCAAGTRRRSLRKGARPWFGNGVAFYSSEDRRRRKFPAPWLEPAFKSVRHGQRRYVNVGLLAKIRRILAHCVLVVTRSRKVLPIWIRDVQIYFRK